MGEVWRARDERLGRDVAIKVLLPDPSAPAERGERVEREARAAGALNHPNVLTVYDVGEHRGARIWSPSAWKESRSARASTPGGCRPTRRSTSPSRSRAGWGQRTSAESSIGT